ncbi:MAG: hypothetical protein LBH98_01350 [Chitinispirillales bacterium]|jgi:hypothetical protein|nr:hypothetical protein [Chitinispirillales bacterium]
MKNFIIIFCILLVFSGCSKKKNATDVKNYVEHYISQLKVIEKPSSEKFNYLMNLMHNFDANSNDSLQINLRDAILETITANKTAGDEFRELALKKKPDYIEDTIQILLVTATALLGQSYEMRTSAITSLNRFVALGTPRFFREYSLQMERAMKVSEQAFFFLTTARVRQRVVTGDTLDMTIAEFLKIPELPPLETVNKNVDSTDASQILYSPEAKINNNSKPE